MKFKRFFSFKNKIFIVVCVCVIIPLLLINLAVSKSYERDLKEKTTQVYGMLSDQIETNIDTYLRTIARISLYPYYNNQIQKIVYENNILDSEAARSKENTDVVNDFLFNMIIQDKYLRSVFITDMDGQVIYAKSNGGYYRDTQFFAPHIESMDTEYGIIATHPQSYVNRSRLEVFSYIRVIKEVNTNTPIGYVILEIDSAAIAEMIARISNVSDELVVIYLEDGSIVSSNIEEAQIAAYQDNFTAIGLGTQSKGMEVVIDNQTYLISASDNSEYGLATVIYQNQQEVMGDLNRLSRANFIWIVLISIAVLTATVLAAGKITEPLIRLRDAMTMVKKGRFDIQVKMPIGNDEVTELTEGFNSMLCSIDELIRSEYKLRLQEREAELKALQNQINPHFLYNTLESVTMLAEINEDSEVTDMVTSLGSFLRFSLTAGDSVVMLQRELACVENYIEIQNIRFNNRIQLQIVCDQMYEKHNIVKMSIQPIVENVLNHGYSTLSGNIFIEIRVFREQDFLVIVIMDCGQGMSKDVLQMVRENLEREKELYTAKQSIGLRNVHQRLRLKYGDDYGLECDSDVGGGTTIRITIPYEMED